MSLNIELLIVDVEEYRNNNKILIIMHPLQRSVKSIIFGTYEKLICKTLHRKIPKLRLIQEVHVTIIHICSERSTDLL